MKKSIFILFLFFAIASPVYAVEVIDTFDARIQIRTDSKIDVVEKILYDFGEASRHGIFRNIPIQYKARGGNFNLRISDIAVDDGQGNAYSYTTSYPGDIIEIKIGDPDVLITGKYLYVIHYTIGRALNFFTDHDELYWNATGDKWQADIIASSATVYLPQGASGQPTQTECFVGIAGSQTPCAGKSLASDGGASFTARALPMGEGLTIVVGFPKGIVNPPTFFQETVDRIVDNWVLGVPLLVLIFMFIQWFRYGRDAKGTGIIIAQYEAPDGLTPIEVGALIDEKVGKKDVAGEIISLAVRGYLKITRLEDKGILFNSTDYSLQKLKPTTDLADFDQELFSFLFSEGGGDVVRVSAFKQSKDTSKPRHYKLMQSQILSGLTEKGYFRKNPETVRAVYLIAGMIVFFLSLFLQISTIYAMVAGIMSGIIILLFSNFMPAKIKKGTLAQEHILGLKLYLSVAEKDRIAFHNAPEKNPERFESLLPYAMVLGVEKEWAKQFEGMNMGERAWYGDSTGAGFNPVLFVASSHSFASSFSSTITAASGSSGLGGGGGAGGGGGGGGGGSW
jgi:uncharacterized membrane protein YgcG